MKNRFEEEESMLADLDQILQEADDDPFDAFEVGDNKKSIVQTISEVWGFDGLFDSEGDHGLSYAIAHANYFLFLKGESEIPTESNWREVLANLLSMDGLIKFYKTRRDSPRFVRDRIKVVFDSIGWSECRPKQSEDVTSEYVDIALTCHRFFQILQIDNKLNDFIKHCVENYEELSKVSSVVCEKDMYDFMRDNDLTNAQEARYKNLVKNVKRSEVEERPTPSNHVQWASDELKIHGENKEEGSFLKRIYASRLKMRIVVNEAIFDTLLARFPHFAEVISFYKAQFRLNMLTSRDYIPPVLLLGSPGIGKTVFAKEFAHALNTGYTFIDMASASASWTLSGLTSSWSGAKPGKLVTAMVDSPTASPIVVLDEIEKSGTSAHGQDPRTPLYQLLEENTAKAFTDEFVDFPVDLSRIIYIACANSTEGLTDPLLTRFQIFEIADPSDDQHGVILESIYQAEVAGTHAFPAHLPHEIKLHLRGQSLRTAKVQISKAISSVLLAMNMEELRNAKSHSINLSIANFQAKPLKKKSMGF